MRTARSAATLAAITVCIAPASAGAATLQPCPVQTDGVYGRIITSQLVNNEGYQPLDDGTVYVADVSAVFPQGVPFAGVGLGAVFAHLWVNANGNLTFSDQNLGYSPSFIPFEDTAPFPILAPWFAEVDLRGLVSDGNQLWYCEDPTNRDILVTWQSVGYFEAATKLLNSFQVKLHNPGDACGTVGDYGLEVEFRYNRLEWLAGNASGGVNGTCPLPFEPPWHGGSGACYPAVAGFDIGNALFAVRLPESGYPDVVNLVNLSNVQDPGVWRWRLVDTCGDGIVDPCEPCDDGNSNNEDACTNVCTRNVCGDGYLDVESGTEICDGTNLGALPSNSCVDYDPVLFTGGFIRCAAGCGSYDFSNCVGKFRLCYADEDGDGFSGTEHVIPIADICRNHSTGGVRWENASDGDCSDDPASVCANVSRPGGTEVCDGCDNDCDGDTDSADQDIKDGDPAATGAFTYFVDGDGDGCGVTASLFCEDTVPFGYAAITGDQDDTDGVCCGNQAVEAGEACDDGNTIDTDACLTNCQAAYCGDSVVWQGEEACDDGNGDDTDACLTTCVLATCGDGFVLAGVEACDDANSDPHDGCVSCAQALCGDGYIRAGVEACDDGNASSGDGCSNGCVVEDGYLCVGEPSICTVEGACTVDADCGSVTSGQVCNDAGACQAGCRGLGGNGCPDGQVCTSTDETIGECEPAGTGGTGGGGAGGEAGQAGAGGGAGGEAGQAGAGGGAGGEAGQAGAGGAGGEAGQAGASGGGGTGGQGGATGGSGGSGHTGAGMGGAGGVTDDGSFVEGGGCSCGAAGRPSRWGWLSAAGLLGAWALLRRASRSRRGR